MELAVATLVDFAVMPATMRSMFKALAETPAGALRHQRAALVVGGLNVLQDFGYDKALLHRMTKMALVAAGVNKAMASGAMAVIDGWVKEYAEGVADAEAEVSENFGGGGKNDPGAAKIHPSLAGIERNKASAPVACPDLELQPLQSPQEIKMRSNAAMAAERWNERTKGR